MQVRIDVKSLVAGVILGAVLVAALGAAVGGAGKADFGIAVENQGYALVRADDGTVYVIDGRRAEAEIVESKSGAYKGRPFNLSRALPPERGQ